MEDHGDRYADHYRRKSKDLKAFGQVKPYGKGKDAHDMHDPYRKASDKNIS